MKSLLSLIIVLGAAGIWFFGKKSPNIKRRNQSIVITLLGVVVLVIVMTINGEFNSKSETAATSSITTSQETSSNSSSTISENSASTSSSSERTYDKEANAQYALYLAEKINRSFSDKGLDWKVTPQINEERIIHLYFPQESKYQSNVDIQWLADAALEMKKSTFNQWVIDNNYPGAVSPILYINSEDGTTLAKEHLMSGTMKLKIDND